LLMTYFYRELPKLVENGHLYLALPPLYRITQGGKTLYARDDAHREELVAQEFTGRGKIEISRFKGLGEMPPAQLKTTTMDPEKRTLLKIRVPQKSAGVMPDPKQEEEQQNLDTMVETLMGKKPELRFAFIQENAQFAGELDV